MLHCFFKSMSCQFSKKVILILQKDTWKLNYIMGLNKCKILQLLLSKLYNTFYPEKKCLHIPLPVTHPLPLCPKLALIAAILRQQQVE